MHSKTPFLLHFLLAIPATINFYLDPTVGTGNGVEQSTTPRQTRSDPRTP